MASFWHYCRRFITQFSRVIVSPVISAVVIVVGLVVCIVTSFSWWQAVSTIAACQQTSEVEPSQVSQELGKLMVYVSGAVAAPGVYQLQLGDRVEAAIKAAGGYHARADLAFVYQQLNLADNLSDGQKIYIPFSGEQAIGAKTGSNDTTATVDSLMTAIATPTSLGISINQASLAELDSLPGVGEKRAQSIVEQRPYAALEELVEKKILPAATFEQLKPQLSL